LILFVFVLKSLAHAEAYIDFHEDQHIENDILTEGMQVLLEFISHNSTSDAISDRSQMQRYVFLIHEIS
jgi:hypothetical protein